MPRYVKQRDGHSCGPIAILNVLKWAGYKITYDSHLKILKKLCKTTIKNGTYPSGMNYGFKRYKKISVKYICKIKAKQIDDHLESGGIVVLLYSWKKPGVDRAGHYVIIDEKLLDTYYNVINPSPSFRPRPTETIWSRNMLIRRLRKSLRRYNDPKGWLISKK